MCGSAGLKRAHLQLIEQHPCFHCYKSLFMHTKIVQKLDCKDEKWAKKVTRECTLTVLSHMCRSRIRIWTIWIRHWAHDGTISRCFWQKSQKNNYTRSCPNGSWLRMRHSSRPISAQQNSLWQNEQLRRPLEWDLEVATRWRGATSVPRIRKSAWERVAN